jgi:hypothetical protein
MGGHDGDGRALRYLEWDRDPDPDDTVFTVDFAYLLQEGDQPVRVEHDRHSVGLFPRDTWLELCRDAGFESRIERIVHSDPAPVASEVILCRRAEAG